MRVLPKCLSRKSSFQAWIAVLFQNPSSGRSESLVDKAKKDDACCYGKSPAPRQQNTIGSEPQAAQSSLFLRLQSRPWQRFRGENASGHIV